MTLQLQRPIDPAHAQPGEPVVARVTEVVRGANGTPAIVVGAAVFGRVEFVDEGRWSRAGLRFDRVVTTKGVSLVDAFAQITVGQRAREAAFSAPSPIAVLLGVPSSSGWSIVCTGFATVPIATSLPVRLGGPIDSSSAVPGAVLDTVVLQTIADAQGASIVRPGAKLGLEIVSVERRPSPTLRIAPRFVETLLGRVDIRATATSGLAPYATVEPAHDGHRKVTDEFFVRQPSAAESAPDGSAGSDRADSRPIRVPEGAELVITLIEPMRVRLPVD